MAPTGFHGLLGLLLATRIDPSTNHGQRIRVGLVWGSTLPDLDILGSSVITLITGDLNLAVTFHRSVTHSLPIIGLLMILGYGWKRNSMILGVGFGMFLHVLLDFLYLEGISWFWPFQAWGDRTYVVPFTYMDLDPLLAKILLTLDGYFEFIFYLVMAGFAKRTNTCHELSISWPKELIIRDWPNKLQRLALGLFFLMIIFLGFAVYSHTWPDMTVETYTIVLYFPLLPVYFISGLLPYLMRETIQNIP
ncbi:MAG: metal-dependent hydrolase [Candidatus Thorarchaeota archaeon]